MSNETTITIRGFAGGQPTVFTNSVDSESGEVTTHRTAVLRVGVTPRYYVKSQGEFRDGPTSWYAVRTYGSLAANVASCVGKGTPVLVRGRLSVREYQDKQGISRSENVIIADSLGIDLSTGTAAFTKVSNVPLPRVPGEPTIYQGPVDDDVERQFATGVDDELTAMDQEPGEESDDPAGVLDAVMA